METFNLPPTLLRSIKKVIDQYSKNEDKPQAYNEFLGYYAKGIITKGQAHKIKSFYETYSTANTEERAKKNLYDAIHILPYCVSQLTHLQNVVKTTSNLKSVVSITPTRTVDRLTKPSLASVRPSDLDTNPMAINEALKAEKDRIRIIELIRKISLF
ncbi:hypothetical protein [Flavobacterium sp. LB1P71]|uniref:hypothetical protein n=1 Tax=Flavobacterium sp. LB1P71 TaxID=3401716 RepID=UPI003AAE23C1